MENYIYGEQGNYALGYRLKLPEKYSLGELDFDNLNEFLSKSLKDLPTGTIFFKQDIFKEERYDSSHFPNRNFLEKATIKYFKDTPYLSHITNIFFILPNTSINFKKLTNPVRPPNKKVFVEFDEKIKEFNIAIDQVINFLKAIRLSGNNQFEIEPLSKEYLSQYYDYINGGLVENYSVDIKNEWEYLRVGSQYASVLKFPIEEKFPDKLVTCRVDDKLSTDKSKFYKNYGDNFGYDLNFTHIYNQIAVIDDNKKHYENAKKNNEYLSKFRKFDRTNEFWANETGKMLDEMAQNSDNERIIRGHNNIVVFANSHNELETRINAIVERFKDIDIKPDRAYGKNLQALYEYSFPLNAHLFVDDHYYIGNLQLFSSFVVSTGKFNDDREGLRLNSRLEGMIPVTVDIWDDDKKYIKARNFFILSPTGGGKSFMANHLVSHYYSDGARQVIIDLGGSYRKLATLFPKDIAYITYNEGDNLGVNPFALREGETLSTAKIEELVEFIGVHFRRDSDLSQQERATLRKIVEIYYESNHSNHSLPSFINAFIKHKDDVVEHLKIQKEFFNVEEFILLMSEFVNGGVYSFLYDENKESFGADLYDKRIIVFELDSIRENKLLLSIMLQLISTTIDKMVWKDKSTRGVILFDEVAEQLKWDGMLRRIQWFYQAIRKQNGSIGIILQSISQLPKNELADAIIDNTQVLYVLDAKDYQAIQNRFVLSQHAFYQMSSLKSDFNAQRKYSEFFLLRGEHHQVYRLEVPKEVFWAYQTDGAMNDLLLKIYNETGDMERAIDIMIANQKYIESLRDEIKTKRFFSEDERNNYISLSIQNLIK